MTFARRCGPGGRETYHHGNLREALVAAALELSAERGPAGFTLAELARAAGVSPAAPYRHFRDRGALLEEVARRGFERLEAALAAAWDGGQPDPLRAFAACGRAYLDFARRHPGEYAVMFARDYSAEAGPAAARAFEALRAAAEVLCARHRGASPPPARMVALHVWSLSHGIAALFARPDSHPLPMSPEDLLESGVLVYLRGLGLLGAGEGAESA